MITKEAWNHVINENPVNSFSGSAITVGLKAFGHELSETSHSIFMAFCHFWIEYKALFSSGIGFITSVLNRYKQLCKV